MLAHNYQYRHYDLSMCFLLMNLQLGRINNLYYIIDLRHRDVCKSTKLQVKQFWISKWISMTKPLNIIHPIREERMVICFESGFDFEPELTLWNKLLIVNRTNKFVKLVDSHWLSYGIPSTIMLVHMQILHVVCSPK